MKRAEKREKRLLKTVVKESIPFLLRPHAYLIFSGGFLFQKREDPTKVPLMDYQALRSKYQENLISDKIKEAQYSELDKIHREKVQGMRHRRTELTSIANAAESQSEETKQILQEIESLSVGIKELNLYYPERPPIKTLDDRDQIEKDILRTYFPQQLEIMQIQKSGLTEANKAHILKLEGEVKELREILQDVLMCHAQED